MPSEINPKVGPQARPVRAFISYSHDSEAHAERVLSLVTQLREDRIDCMIDQFLNGTPPQGWPVWMDSQVEEADFILVVCTKTYFDRATGKEKRGTGKGVKWESLLLQQEIFDNAGLNPKVVPVHFGELVESVIPRWLRPVSRYRVDERAGYEKLYRFLMDQPLVRIPELGFAKTLPSKTPNPLFPPRTEESQQLQSPPLQMLSKWARDAGGEEDFSQMRVTLKHNIAPVVNEQSGKGKASSSRQEWHSRMAPISPQTTLAVMLGASDWPFSKLPGGPPFSNSAQALSAYLLDPRGFNLPREQMLNLFNDTGSPSDILLRLGEFLESQTHRQSFTDVLLYYVGHGLFHGADNHYHLAIKQTKTNAEGITSLRIADLADRLQQCANFQRRFVILDSCFAAAALPSFQSNSTQVAVQKAADAFPTRGTLIYCSSNKNDPSLAPPDRPYTMFSGALIESLRTGEPELPARFNVSALNRLVWARIRDQFAEDTAVRPEFHSPDKREGDLAELPLFPNPAFRAKPEFKVKRVPKYGSLTISSSKGGTVFLDGTKIDMIDEFEEYQVGHIRAGSHRIKLTNPSFPEVEKRFVLHPDEHLMLDLSPQEEPESPRVEIPRDKKEPSGKRKMMMWLVPLLLLSLLLLSIPLMKFLSQTALDKKPSVTEPGSTLQNQQDEPADQEREVSGGSGSAGESVAVPAKPSENGKTTTARKAGDVEVFEVKGVKFEMVWCPPGEFLMGSPENEPGRSDDEPQHQVSLTQGFWMGQTEVAQEQWKAVMNDLPAGLRGNDELRGDQKPVVLVSWDDIQVFIQRLNETTGKSSFHLPTESEWEYACRAGAMNYSPFHFGNKITTDQLNFNGNFPLEGNPKGLFRGATVKVKRLPSNNWGLHEMHGNVWEWCQDWYGSYPQGEALNPKGSATGLSRVIRGGSWNSLGGNVRSAARSKRNPANRDGVTGFRLSRD